MTMNETDQIVMPSVWSPDAAALISFVLRFWFDNRRPPNTADVYHGMGFDDYTAGRLYRELQLGLAAVVADDRLQLNIIKMLPFSATPTPHKLIIDGQFITYLGCAGEVFSVSGLPMLEDTQYEVQSSCSCCYAPIRLRYFGPELQTPQEELPMVAVVGNPRMWEHGVPADRVCDDFHFVLDDAHAERFGRRISRRHVTMEALQLAALSRPIAQRRLRDPASRLWLDAQLHMNAFASLGVDIGLWRAADDPAADDSASGRPPG
jgi:Alkylmercury lyase